MEINPERYTNSYPFTGQTETLILVSQAVRAFQPDKFCSQVKEATGQIEGRIVAENRQRRVALRLDYRLRTLGADNFNLTEASFTLHPATEDVLAELFNAQAQYVSARERRWLAAFSIASSNSGSSARLLVHKSLEKPAESPFYIAYREFFRPQAEGIAHKLSITPVVEVVNGVNGL